VAHLGKLLQKNLKGRTHYINVDVDEMVILKYSKILNRNMNWNHVAQNSDQRGGGGGGVGIVEKVTKQTGL
jgi:hypothetical protein